MYIILKSVFILLYFSCVNLNASITCQFTVTVKFPLYKDNKGFYTTVCFDQVISLDKRLSKSTQIGVQKLWDFLQIVSLRHSGVLMFVFEMFV